MAHGLHYAKLSLSSALRLSFFWQVYFVSCYIYFLKIPFSVVFVCLCLCFVDVPLIFFCPADHVPDWQPRILLV